MTGAALLLLSVLVGVAQASPEDFVGLRIADVSLVAGEGQLPEGDFEPLLRSADHTPLDLALVAADTGTLFRVGEFAAVEAEVQPWLDYDADTGEPIPALLLTYVVYPAPQAVAVKVTGARAVSRRAVLDAARVDIGRPFHAALDAPRVRERVQDLLARSGFPDAVVEVDVSALDGLDREIWIRVQEGPPRLVERVLVTGEPPVPHERIKRWARRAGVREGKPIALEAIPQAEYAIQRRLAETHGPIGTFVTGNRGGWVQARVRAAALEGTGSGIYVTFSVDPGRQLLVETENPHLAFGFRPLQRTKEALGIDDRLRLTRGFVEDAPSRLEDALFRTGFNDARATVTLTDQGESAQVLRVAFEPGTRHVLRRPGLRFHGNGAISDQDLRVLMRQASADVIRYGRLTEDELSRALAAAEERYRSLGYLGARLVPQRHPYHHLLDEAPTEVPWSTRPRLWFLPFAPAVGASRRPGERRLPQLLYVDVDVTEGPRSTLKRLDLAGLAEEVDPSAFTAEMARLVDGGFSPQSLDALSRRLVETHRALGYLDANARVVAERVAENDFDAVIAVEPGDRVRLRSVVTRGARRMRPGFLRREVDLAPGQVLGTDDLERVRRNLYELGAFRSVRTELLGDGDARDLVIAVEERPRLAEELGFGASTDQGVRVFNRTTLRQNRGNFWQLYGLVGLDWRGDTLADWVPDFTQPEWRLALGYTEPRVVPLSVQPNPKRALFPELKLGTRFVLDLVPREVEQERLWRIERTAVHPALESHVGRTTLRFGTRVEWRRLTEVDPGALLDGEPWHEVAGGSTIDLPTAWRHQDVVSVLAVHDSRDDVINPVTGSLLSGALEWVPGLRLGPGSSTAYLRTEASAGAWLSLGELRLHPVARAGRLWMLGDGIPAVEDRYRLGGTGSMRGFRRDAVGPRNLTGPIDLAWPDQLAPIIEQAILANPDRWVSTGGDTVAVASLEVMVPFPLLGFDAWEGYDLVLFSDVGNVWLLGANASATSDGPPWTDTFAPVARYALGVGARVLTPIGPLRADVAINPEALRRNAVGTLLRDTWEEPPVRVHVSLGSL